MQHNHTHNTQVPTGTTTTYANTQVPTGTTTTYATGTQAPYESSGAPFSGTQAPTGASPYGATGATAANHIHGVAPDHGIAPPSGQTVHVQQKKPLPGTGLLASATHAVSNMAHKADIKLQKAMAPKTQTVVNDYDTTAVPTHAQWANHTNQQPMVQGAAAAAPGGLQPNATHMGSTGTGYTGQHGLGNQQTY